LTDSPYKNELEQQRNNKEEAEKQKLKRQNKQKSVSNSNRDGNVNIQETSRTIILLAMKMEIQKATQMQNTCSVETSIIVPKPNNHQHCIIRKSIGNVVYLDLNGL
jgi:FtsZ-interacting cell division protein YlmF